MITDHGPIKLSDHLMSTSNRYFNKRINLPDPDAHLSQSGGRKLLQTCNANTYSYSGSCYPCANGSTCNAGSSGYTSCICNVPTYRIAFDIIYGRSDYLGTDATAYGGARIFIIMNYIFPKFSPKVGTVITSWTVTTVKACTIQPFYTGAGNDYFYSNPSGGAQNYYIVGMTDPVVIPGAGTYTFPWTSYASRPGNTLSSTNSISLGWYDVSGSGNCISTNIATSASQTFDAWGPLNPIWMDAYYNYFGGKKADVALQINSDPVGVPSVMTCNNCSQNYYYVSNTQCNACPANSISPAGSPNIDSCVCNKANMLMSASKACVCNQNYYMSGGTTCNACPGNLVSPVASTMLSNCACKAPAVPFNSTYCTCDKGTFGDGVVCTSCASGSYCPLASTASNACPLGTYCATPSTSVACSAGMFCTAGSTAQQPCQAGSYCATPSTQVQCPVDSYCPASSTVPIACATYFHSVAGSSTIGQCILSCPANNYCISNVIYPCPANSTSVAGATSLSQCTCTNAQQSIINNKCSCPSGKFLNRGNCVTCPLGMVCAVTFDAATCSPGSYCPEGSTSETPCQAGSYCSTPSTQVQCPINTYCPAGTVTPINCPVDFISPAGSTLSTQCEAAVISVDFAVDGASISLNQSQFQQALPSNVQLNTYQDVLVLTAGVCPQGYYCPPDTTTAIPCPARTYNNNTNAMSVSDCLTCPVGQYCPLASVLPTSCPAGSYRIVEGAAQQSDCTVCPTGNYCPIQSVTPTNCSAGTYGPNPQAKSSGDCQSCPAGEYCPVATTTPVACAAGSYRGSTGGAQQSDCNVCPAGQFCPQLSVTPTDCAAGSYRGSVGGTQQGDCTTCPTGNFCPVKSVDPTNCSVSTYNPSTGGASSNSCLSCPAGQYCPIATTSPVSCAAGSYRGSTGAGAQADCATCPTGNYCPVKSIDPSNCSAGTYNPSTGQTSSASCLSCPAGDYCPVATTTPQLCTANTFTAATGAAVCAQCPVFSTSPIASTNCTCDAGHYHVVTTSGGASSLSASLTEQDTIYGGVAPITPGTDYYLQLSGSSHMVVTKGVTVTFTSTSLASMGTSGVFTLDLFRDIFNARAYVLRQSNVDTNWIGWQYVDVIPAIQKPFPAQQNVFKYSQGLTGNGTVTMTWDTTNVPSGLYFVAAPLTSFFTSPLSVFVASPTPTNITYSPSINFIVIAPVTITAGCIGDTLTLYKPTGLSMYSSVVDSYVSCISKIENSDTPTVTVLAQGKSPLVWTIAGIDNTMQCYVSFGGSIEDVDPYSLITVYPRPVAPGPISSTLTCSNCSSGYKSSPGAQVCTECGLGYYSSPVSQTCTACPAGTKCPTTTTAAPVNCGVGLYQAQSTQSTCLPCPVGQYCDLNVTVTPKDCPAGTFRGTEGAASLADCQTCTAGNFCPVKSVTPTNCAAGSYRSTTGGQSQGDCSTCTAGNYCPIQSVNPTNCTAGSFRSTTGAQSQADCATCTTGHYCPIQSVNPTDCLAGTYNPSTGGQQSQDCLACPEGEFCPTATTTPTACAAGSYRGEKGAQSQAGCTVCPSGNYCPVQSINPTNCTPGTYNPSAGSTSSAACLSCPLGDYCLVATTNPSFCAAGSYRGTVGATDQVDCTVCPSGNYCPIQSINPVNCSSGTFRPTTAGAAVSDCTVCATGKYSMAVASSTDCPLCPVNYYCTNSITIKTCPTHTSSAAGSSSLLNCRCDQGYKCAYSKRITAIVTLNSTTSSFNNDVGGIKTAFINAVANAAGVSSNQVTINNVAAKPTGGRRLLSVDESFIDVYASVQGAERLHKLDFHLARHSATLHQGHSWEEAHSVTSTPVRRGIILSTR